VHAAQLFEWRLTGVIDVNKTIGRFTVAGTIFSAFVAHAASVGNIVVVRPSELPAASREYSEAMMLHETVGGRMFLYIEQEQGTKLTVLDVTNPAKIKAEKPVALNVPGPFDFVGSAGSRNELIRFRGTGQEAVLDLRRAKVPSIDVLPELTVTGHLMTLGEDSAVMSPAQYQIVDTAGATPHQHVADVIGVKQEINDNQTGTTYLLAEEGLFVVRRPSFQASVLESVANNSGG
jgi:hypothetical protein